MNENNTPDSHDEHEESVDYKEYKHTAGHPGHTAHTVNGYGPYHEHDKRGENVTGALPALGNLSPNDYTHIESPEFEYLVQSLHDIFERDRQVASQPDSTRCGICYLNFAVSELHYREEGFYACSGCEHVLGKQRISMLHKQQKM